MPCYLVRQFHVLHFHVLLFGPPFSCPAISCPAIRSVNFMSCNVMSVIFSARVCGSVCRSVRLSLKWSDLLQVKNKIFKFRGMPGASLVKKCSWVDSDFFRNDNWTICSRQSALIFEVKKTYTISAVLVTWLACLFVNKWCLLCFRVFVLSFFLICCRWYLFTESI